MFDVGRAVPFHVARDPVNRPVLRRWCDAMGATNPVHLDPAVATRSCFGRIVSPLAMLDVWTKPGLAYRRDTADPQGGAFQVLDGEGYTSSVAVSSELTQQRALVEGDVVRSTIMLESVSAEKATALGAGRFVTTRQDFFVGDEPVGHSRFTVMKFRPAGDTRAATPPGASAGGPASEEARRAKSPVRGARDGPPGDEAAGVDRGADDGPAPARDELGTVRASGLAAGQRLPPATIPVTTTLIVSGALMTSDYFDAHHDRDAAVRRGSPHVFMNIHTTLGLIESRLSGWLGPNTRWRSLRVRLGVPNYPGDTLVIDSEVTTVDDASGAVTVTFRAVNGLGVHASGSADVELPA